jgi:hypothetical protein
MLPAEQQRRTLQTLSRMLAQQLLQPPAQKEADHERS